MGVKIQGLVAVEGLETVDGRKISGIDWHGFERFPAYLLEKQTVGHEGSKIFGWFKIDAIRSGLVIIKGELDFWPDEAENYLGVGIDLDNIEYDKLEHSFASANFEVTGGRLRAMHVYGPDSGAKPSWPFVRIWRVGE